MMRLVTWNVLWRFEPDWQEREAGILEMLDLLQPDVVGLQECWGTAAHTQADVVAAHLGMYAAFDGPSLPPVPDPPEHPGQAGVEVGLGLVSRWPITDIRTDRLPATHRAAAPVALRARIAHPDTPFEVIVAATEWEPRFVDDHLAQTRFLSEMLREPAPNPVFLLGDLNCDSTQRQYDAFAVASIGSTWGAHVDEFLPAVTLSSQVPFAPIEAFAQIDRRIDHILYAHDRGVTVQEAFTVPDPIDGVFPSDHFPVVADVRLQAS
jgi:endonuclease/exonuclease/phosphatase family metal-dependent hydrolase